MQTYFRYSEIINSICNNLRERINRYAYTGDWQVMEGRSENRDSDNSVSRLSLPNIGELYY